ncbi:MAG: Holliday junction resolvase RuvX [Endomicrobium sp.]|nr:Holliday junction resolvase RuvX [Endomicrobium sp.]
MFMSRLMAIDYGFKKIGIALTDPLQIIAKPFQTIKNISLINSAAKIVSISKEQNVTTIVLGLPINMDGTFGKMTKYIYQLSKTILKLTDIQIVTLDERLTTQQAKDVLIILNINSRSYKLIEDIIAAALILQTYLELKS